MVFWAYHRFFSLKLIIMSQNSHWIYQEEKTDIDLLLFFITYPCWFSGSYGFLYPHFGQTPCSLSAMPHSGQRSIWFCGAPSRMPCSPYTLSTAGLYRIFYPNGQNAGMSVEILGFSLESVKSVGVLQIQSCDTSHGIVLLIVILSRSSCGRSEVLDSLRASFSILIINIIFCDNIPDLSSLSTAF